MKKIILLISILLTTISCATISYKNKQTEINTFDEEIIEEIVVVDSADEYLY